MDTDGEVARRPGEVALEAGGPCLSVPGAPTPVRARGKDPEPREEGGLWAWQG